MAEKDKLVEQLENFTPPVWSNPEHQDFLKARLERLIQESPAPSKQAAFRWQPLVALASAALFLVFGGVFFLQNRMVLPPEKIQWKPLPVVMTTGSSSVLQNGQTSLLEAGKQVDKDARITVAADSVLSFMLPGEVTVRVQGPAELMIDPEMATPSGRYPGIRLLSGVLQAKQVSGQKEKYAFAVGDTVYQPSSTVFQLSSEGSGDSRILVQQGTVIVSQKGMVKNQYQAKVTAGQSYSVDTSGVGSLESGDAADIDSLASFGSEEQVSFRELDSLVPMTVRAQPPESVISVDGSMIGRGTVSFMAEAGRHLEVTANAEGFSPETKNLVIEKSGSQIIGFELKPVEGPAGPSRIPIEPEVEPEPNNEKEKPDDVVRLIFPERTINFTGRRADWTEAFSFPDKDSQAVSEPGCDVDQIYLSKSGKFLFIGVAFINKLPNNNLRPEMAISLTGNNGDQIEVLAYSFGTEWRMRTDAVMSGKSAKITGENIMLVGDDILELRLDLASLGTWVAELKSLDVSATLKIQKFESLKTKPDTVGPFRIDWQ